jgi:CMP-N,N'-diacetyllegionaminic acid synthase
MLKLCTICARGGSKGLANKNIKPIIGVPLIAHSLMQARKAGIFAQIAVSSDSDEILAVAKEWGADALIKRPAELATDTAPKVPVIRHALREAEKQFKTTFDVLVDLDATSPLRSAEDIKASVEMLAAKNITNVITACPSRRSPYFNLIEKNPDGRLGPAKTLPGKVTRRQDAPKTFDMNASIYVWRRQTLLDHDQLFLDGTVLYEMPEGRSHDIDSPLDFEIVEFLMQREKARFQYK